MRIAGIYLIPLLIYALSLVLFGDDILNKANPDFFSYYRIALYWANGDFSYAISGYWGPLFSWLMVPFISMSGEPVELAWYAVYFSGATFIIASGFFFSNALISVKYQMVGVVTTAIFASYFAKSAITPDLLMSAFILFGYSILIKAFEKDSVMLGALAGFSFGFAYLTKTPGIVIGFGFILGISAFLRIIDEVGSRTVRRVVFSSTSALLLISIPWIIVLSSHYDTFTWSTVANRSQQVTTGKSHENFTTFHIPRSGRITSWEDPTEIETAVKAPTRNAEGKKVKPLTFVGHAHNILTNLKKIYLILFNPPWYFIVWGAVVAFLLHAENTPRFLKVPWKLGLLGSAVIIAPYLLSYVGPQRYFIACFPLLMASTLGLISWAEKSGLFNWFITKWLPTSLTANLFLALFMSITLYPIIYALKRPQSNDIGAANYFYTNKIANKIEQLGLAGPTADIGFHLLGLYTAFHLDKPYYGAELNTDNVGFLTDHGAKILITIDPLKTEVKSNAHILEISNLFYDEIPILETNGVRIFSLYVTENDID